MQLVKETIDAPYQIVCEGRDDAEFYSRLIRDRAINGYNVGCGCGEDSRPLGKDGFRKRIQAALDFSIVPIKGFVIIADSDDSPSRRFTDAARHFQGHGFPIPKVAMQAFENAEADKPKTAIIMVPSFGVEGGLETLALSCCDQLTEHRGCIDDFCQCVYTPRRSLDFDKLKLRALIAAHNPDDPSASISRWVSSRVRPFEMTHPALDEIARFLTGFAV
jgi:hypothetical protein